MDGVSQTWGAPSLSSPQATVAGSQSRVSCLVSGNIGHLCNRQSCPFKGENPLKAARKKSNLGKHLAFHPWCSVAAGVTLWERRQLGGLLQGCRAVCPVRRSVLRPGMLCQHLTTAHPPRASPAGALSPLNSLSVAKGPTGQC